MLKLTYVNGQPVVTRLEPTPEYEEFMAGFRRGFPLIGEPFPPDPVNPSPEYQRGLEAGKRYYKPGLHWTEDVEELE